MAEPNVFSALSRYNAAQENTLTESFVFLLRLLLVRQPEVALQVLNQLCGNGSSGIFDSAEAVTIVTQSQVGDGWVDIEIRAPDTLFYVEVKHDSLLGIGQLEYYFDHLKARHEARKNLVLLTRSRISEIETTLLSGRDFHYVRWGEVYSWLHKAEIQDEVCLFFAQAFNRFLQEKNMSMDKVSWEYMSGVLALNQLVKMLETAIPEALPKVNFRRSGGWSWRGFYIDPGLDFYFGVYYDHPLVMTFENNRGDKPSYEQALDLEKTHFFALTGDEQFQLIVDFLKKTYAGASKSNTTTDTASS